MRIILWAAIALGLTGGIVGVLGAGTAAAQPVSLTLRYTCSFPLINDQSITARIQSDIPKSIAVGESSQRFTIDAVTTVGATLTQGLGLIGMKTVEGTVDAKTSVAAPHGDISVTVPMAITRTSIPASGSFDVSATGTAPTLRFSQPGNGKITVGGLVLHLVPRNASGDLTFLGKLDVPCTLDAGQDNAAIPFDITGTTTATGSVASGTTGAPGTRTPTASETTRPTTNGTTSSTTSGAAASTGAASGSTKPTTEDPASATATTGGRDAEGPILLAVGTAGTLVAGAAAVRFGSRLRNRRRTADDLHGSR